MHSPERTFPSREGVIDLDNGFFMADLLQLLLAKNTGKVASIIHKRFWLKNKRILKGSLKDFHRVLQDTCFCCASLMYSAKSRWLSTIHDS